MQSQRKTAQLNVKGDSLEKPEKNMGTEKSEFAEGQSQAKTNGQNKIHKIAGVKFAQTEIVAHYDPVFLELFFLMSVYKKTAFPTVCKF